jgi:hypothetical protein
MTNAQPGWFPDPYDASKRRWWDGQRWTDTVSSDGVGPDRDARMSRARVARRVPTWAWVLIGAVAVFPALLLAPLIAPIALIVLITAIVGLSKGSRTWLRLGSRKAAIGVTAAAAAVLLVTGSVSAAVLPNASHDRQVSQAVPFTGGTKVDKTEPAASRAPTPTRKSTPSPTPRTSTRTEKTTEPILFEATSVDDGALPRGQSQVTVAGANGEKALIYRVTLVDGVETARELISESVSVPPVTQVTTVGTYDPPPPAAEPPPQAALCDSNYADVCVPIASDVDCAWGTGDGPAYLDGVARVVGTDIYGLDRNGDGYACER